MLNLLVEYKEDHPEDQKSNNECPSRELKVERPVASSSRNGYRSLCHYTSRIVDVIHSVGT